MEIKYLNTFKAILETGSFQKAAERLHYAQSTVTLQMQLLEQALSVKLFEKIGRQMRLTQAGKELIPYMEQVLNAVQQMEDYGKGAQALTGTLRISMPETLLIYQMLPVLQRFRKAAPNVRLSISSTDCYHIRSQVLNGEIDLGIHYDIGGYGTTIVAEPLQSYEFVLIGSHELSPEDADFLSGNQRKRVCLLSDRGSCYAKKFHAYLEKKDIVPENDMDLFSTEAIKQMVKANLGVAYLPRFTVEKELRTGDVQEIPTDIPDPNIGTVYTYHKNKWLTSAMNLLIRFLRENQLDRFRTSDI